MCFYLFILLKGHSRDLEFYFFGYLNLNVFNYVVVLRDYFRRSYFYFYN